MKKPVPAENDEELRQQYKKQLASFGKDIPALSMTTFSTFSEFMEPIDRKEYSNVLQTHATRLGTIGLVSLAANMVLTSANPKNFLKLPKTNRLLIRGAIFAIPILVANLYFWSHDKLILNQIESDYNSRLKKFRLSWDFSDMDPKGLIFAEHMKNLRALEGRK